jgi:ornithine cyclodeaminase
VDLEAPIFVTDPEVRRWVGLQPVMAAVKDAFVALGEGRSEVFPVSIGAGSDPRHFFASKSGRDGASGLLGVKAGSYNPPNRLQGKAAHTSTTMVFDDATGALVGVVEANYLNSIRTAAADGIATDLLARPDAHVLGVIGLGAQAEFEALAVCAVRPITKILAATRSPIADARFSANVSALTGVSVEIRSVEAVVRDADILVTATPSTDPLLETEWVRPGTHISAMGADTVGKQELPLDLVARASLVVDLARQAAVIGEAQHIVARSLRTVEDLASRALGKLLASGDAGRASPDEITIFDSSGLAIQDIAAAAAALAIVRKMRADGGAAGPSDSDPNRGADPICGR